jgi:transcriptional regulator with XRE-family HTH domain
MPLVAATRRNGYARVEMPKAKQGDGPWGEAIRYWLGVQNRTQADLVRLLNDKDFVKAYKGRPVTAKTVSRIARGFDTQTRLLRRIAAALNLSIDVILVAPGRTLANERRIELARQISEEVLRTLEAKGVAPQANPKVQEVVERVTRLVSDESLSTLLTAVKQMEESERRVVSRKPTASKKTIRRK